MPSFLSVRQVRNAFAIFSAAAVLNLLPVLAGAQAIYDAQVPISTTGVTVQQPGAVAVAADGVLYTIANKKVVKIVPDDHVSGSSGSAAKISATASNLAPSITISNPSAVAVGPAGELYIADPGKHQVIKLANPETSSSATNVTYSTGTQNPTALAVDAAGNLYVADQTARAIYKVTAGVGTSLTIPNNLKPSGLAVDSAGNIYFADAQNNRVYKYSAGSTSIFLSTSAAGNFRFSSGSLPVGMGFDPAGNLYVLDSGWSSGNDILIEAATTGGSNNFEVPFSSISNPGSMAIDSTGNLYVTNVSSNRVEKLFYNNNPVSVGSLTAGHSSPQITLNYNFLNADSGLKYFQSMQGDNTGEFGGSPTRPCTSNGRVNAGAQCSITATVTYQNTIPGFRSGVFGLTDNSGAVMAVPVNGISLAAALALYPGTQFTVADGTTSPVLYEPQGLAVTGNGGTLFVADEGGIINQNDYSHGNVYMYTNGMGNAKYVSSSGAFDTPMGLAVDAAGNLYVASYSGIVTKVPPPWNKIQPAMNIPGVTLYHPMSLAIDPSGNLFIGDMGASGSAADAAHPGFIVKVPANGAPATVLHYTVNGSPIIFPQALAVDSFGNLFIADGGDGQGNMGGVDVVPAATGVAVALPFNNGNQLSSPSGLSIDAANDLYVLDSYNQRILWVPVTYGTGGVPSISASNISALGDGSDGLDSVLVTASNLVLWPGGQKITIADIGLQPLSGQGTPSQVVTLDTTNAYVDASSGSASVMGLDVGNQPITFATPSRSGSSNFTLGGCGTSSSSVTPGVQHACTSTINYNGPGQETATFTLRAPNNSNYVLGNQIIASASPNLPTGKLAVTNVGDQQITVTLTNVGLQSLRVSNVSLAAGSYDMIIVGGTCSSTTILAQNQTCTVVVSMGLISGGNLVVTDNNKGVPGTQQQIYLWYFVFGGGALNTAGNASAMSAPVSTQNRPGIVGQALGSGNGTTSFQPFIPSFFQATSPLASESDESSNTHTNGTVKKLLNR